MADYSGEADIHGTAPAGQLAFYAPADVHSFRLSYTNGDSPITVSGMRGLPPSTSQESGTTETYTIQNPEGGVLVRYTGPMTLQWTWLPNEG